jgi:hypothetical protein
MPLWPSEQLSGNAVIADSVKRQTPNAERSQKYCVAAEGGSPGDAMFFRGKLGTIVPDRLDRATLHRFLAQSLFLRGLGLMKDVGVTGYIVTSEAGRRSLSALIAINALIIDIIAADYVL